MRRPPYELSLESRVEAGPRRYRFRAADGVCSKQSFRTPELLLLEALWDRDPGRLLSVEANYGVVGTVLAATADAVRMTDSSARAVRLCERNCRENGVDASVDLRFRLVSLPRRFDTVAYAPRPFTPVRLGRQRLVESLSVLRPDGRLFLAASPRTGLARYENCPREAGADVEEVRTADDHRVLRATPPATIESPAPLPRRRLRPSVNGVDLSLVTLPGVFAASSLDDGTRLLMESVVPADGEDVLDLCCGYGALGAYAGRAADCDVWLSDDSAVATDCAERSLRASNVDGTVRTADCLSGVADRSFDRVLCNPPTHAGEGVLSDLLAGAHGVLAPGGRLDVVHHRALDFSPHLTRYGNVDTLAEGDEHAVLRATR